MLDTCRLARDNTSQTRPPGKQVVEPNQSWYAHKRLVTHRFHILNNNINVNDLVATTSTQRIVRKFSIELTCALNMISKRLVACIVARLSLDVSSAP